MPPSKEISIANLLQWGSIIVAVGMSFASLKERVETIQQQLVNNQTQITSLQVTAFELREQISVLKIKIESKGK